MNDDNGLMFWEEHAHGAVIDAIDRAEYDEVRGKIVLSPSEDDYRLSTEASNISELRSYLIEIYNELWYAYVPFEGGSAVFEDDAEDFVSYVIDENSEFADFFGNFIAPQNTFEIITASQLLESANASLKVRVSLEEINEELIKYLAEHPYKMRDLAPRKFEELVADMFRNQGYDVTITPPSKDGGVDIIAVQKDGVGTALTLVECKRYSDKNRVGVEIARGLYGVVEQRKATRGIIATTSYFTRGAVNFRDQVPYRLGLADFDVLTQEIKEWTARIRK